MNVWKKEIQQIIKDLNSSRIGLTTEEAKKRIEENGYNMLNEKKKKSMFLRFINQFNDFMIIILIIASIVSAIVSYTQNEGYMESIAIIVVILLNAIIGVMQEYKAEKSLEALKKMNTHKVKTLRDKKVSVIDSKELVLGDVCIFEAGDFIPADFRLLESTNLKLEESALTGESLSVGKDAMAELEDNIPLGDRKNMLYSSSLVTNGTAKAICISTGMDTELGKIATMLENTENIVTPLEKKLTKLGKTLGIVCLIICAVIFLVGILYGNSIITMLMTSISLAIAAIPEGLPAIATIILAVGVQKLAKEGAIVKRLPAVETLGSTTVIASDKTGTLTQNKMTVQKIFVNDKEYAKDDIVLNETANTFVLNMMLCNNTRINEQGKLIGDPTETALIKFAFDNGFESNVLSTYKKVLEIPFDSDRKRMTVVYFIKDKYYVFSKGGTDEIIEICKLIEKDMNVLQKIEDGKESIEKYNEKMANEALRVLACSYKILDKMPDSFVEYDTSISEELQEDLESNQIFLGLIGMMDPPREEVKQAIVECKTAGIRPIMITGDHKITAKAIGQKLGIVKENDEVLTGHEIDALTDEEFARKIKTVNIFARVSPEHKVRIVSALQANDEITAMTGDGVNDAPALKKADIGCAMGITGTDVSKEAAELIITDDNFSTIVYAVKEGRKIYQNILKAIHFLLAANIGEILVIFFAMLIAPVLIKIFGFAPDKTELLIPLIPIQLLWINLVTDTLPALALAIDPARRDIMTIKPEKKEHIFTKGMVFRIIYQGIMIAILTLTAYVIGLTSQGTEHQKIQIASTMAFYTLAFLQFVLVFNIRDNEKTIFSKEIFSNTYLLIGIAISILLMLGISVLPFTRELFNIVLLPLDKLLYTGLLILSPIVIIEIMKALGLNTSKEEKEKHIINKA